MRQVANHIVAPRDPDAGGVERVVGTFEEAIEHPQLVEDFHRRGVDGVAAKIAEEVGVFFKHFDRQAGTR